MSVVDGPLFAKEPRESGLNVSSPIVHQCLRIQNILLKHIDFTLWKALASHGIEPQLYGM
jgi:hypothetical protein